MAVSKTQLEQLYLAYFGRPADLDGLVYYTTNPNMDIWQVAAAFSASPESQALFGAFGAAQINAIYQNLFNRDAEPDGMAYWLGEVASGRLTPGGAAYGILLGAQNDDLVAVTNKMAISSKFAAEVNTAAEIIGYSGSAAAAIARAYLKTVDHTAASVTAAEANLASAVYNTTTTPPAPEPTGSTMTLTVGQDTLAGNNAADIFKANVVQNSQGGQVNTLGSGDELNGNGGIDTLNAKITTGAFVDGYGSWTMPIQPETNSIEIVNFEAVEKQIGYSDENQNAQVYVNAKDMVGVKELTSLHSDADLIIQNLTSQGSNKLSDMTIGMRYTGNADTRWGASDLTVYFDQDYLTPEATSSNPTIDILAMNEDAYDATGGARPLAGVFFRELTVTVNGERFDLTEYMGEDPAGKGEEIQTYAELLVAVKAAIVQLKADHPGNAALQTLQAELGVPFNTDVDPVTLVQRTGQTIRLTVDGITNGVANTLSVASTDLEVARAAAATVENNNRYERADNDPATPGERLAINVSLEKVGLAGDGGELIIGSMNKHEGNYWNAVNTTTDTTSGIEEFNVTVFGKNDKSSSLAGLHSTNNNLRVVTVVTDAALTGTSFADLTIGNSNTRGDIGAIPSLGNAAALKDVQTFDASGFKGDLSLHAALTYEVAAKYLDLQDEAAPAADNVAFEYTGGTGNDYFNVAVETDNWDEDGSATREDFTLNIDGGAGDDVITLGLVNGDGLDNGNYFDFGLIENIVENWYDNQKLMANISIDGGDGNDTIWKPGSGDVIINGGAGNDTVYADNTGARAVWAYNVATSPVEFLHVGRNQINNLQSDVNNSYNLFETDVVVNFKGFEVKAAIATTNGKATDLSINQAIKKAINSDPVLSKLLVAKDGPGHTLVVTSLIDGEMDSALSITLEGPTAADLSAGEVNQLRSWYGSSVPATDAASFATYFGAQIAAFNAKADYDENFALDGGSEISGGASWHISDNTITGGTGNDVLVLGTGAMSNDTIVYSGFGNGTDTIVNFTTSLEFSTEITIGDSEDTSETFTVTFPTLTSSAAAATITFDSAVVSLANFGADGSVRPAADVAREFAMGYNLIGGNWTADWVEGTAQVKFTQNGTGNYDNGPAAGDTDVVAADFVFGGGVTGTVAISNYVDGTDAYVAPASAGFTVDLNGSAAIANDSFVFSYDINGAATGGTKTVSVAYLAGDGPLALAAKFAAALNASGDWVATTNNDGIVEVEAVVPGSLNVTTYVYDLNGTEITDAETNGVEINITGSFDGAAQQGTPGTVYVLERAANDYIDFSAYDAVGVIVDGVLVAGATATAGQNYIVMTESATNDGAYTAQVFKEAGTTDTSVGVIGVLDFGVEQDFVAENFII